MSTARDKFRPKFALTALSAPVHAANKALRPVDSYLFSPPPYPYPGPVFIVGAPRSGSTLTFQVLTKSLRVTYLPRLLDYGYGSTNLVFRLLHKKLAEPPSSFMSSYGKISGPLSPSEGFGYWMKWFFKGLNGDHCFSTRLPLQAACDLRRQVHALQGHLSAPLLAKCLYLSLAVTALADAIPNCRFLFIRRDPVSIAASVLRARQKHRGVTWWSTRPPGFLDKARDPLAEQVAWQVSAIISIVSKSLSKISEDRWRMRWFEDLCTSPAAFADDITDWLANSGFECRSSRQLPRSFELPSPPSTHEVELLSRTQSFGDLTACRR